MKKKNTDLTSRNYGPSSDDIFYHYCNEEVFWSICSSNSIWLSSIYAMNDANELAWGREILLKTLKDQANMFPREFRIFVVLSVFNVDGNLLPLVASFSKNGDLLSQWRAYADDGKGFAVGFDSFKATRILAVNMKSALYEVEEQNRLVLNSLKSFYSYWKKYRDNELKPIVDVLTEFSIDLVSLKHPSFFEEQEVRMVHLLTKSDDSWCDPGGDDSEGNAVPGYPVKMRVRGTEEIPYIEMPLIDQKMIRKIILGPKNTFSINGIKGKLRDMSLHDVDVERSHSSYR